MTKLRPRISAPAGVLLVSLSLSSLQARAEPSAADRAVAESLYEEGRKLMQANRYSDACPKFEESQRLDPGVGTLLYLGSCYDKVGKTASAWIIFREAATAAHAGNQPDREKRALALASALEPRLAKIEIVVSPASDRPGLQIKRDGTPFGRALWGSAIPVDLGTHSIEISAPSFKPMSLSVSVSQTGQTLTVQIPPLEPLETAPAVSSSAPAVSSSPPPPPPPPTTTAVAAPTSTTLRTAALIAGGVGLVGVGLGSYFGLRAFSQWDDSRPMCPADRCSPQGYDLATSSTRSGNYSTLFFALGAAGLGTGAVLWIMAPSATSTGQRSPSLSVGVAGPGLVARGSW